MKVPRALNRALSRANNDTAAATKDRERRREKRQDRCGCNCYQQDRPDEGGTLPVAAGVTSEVGAAGGVAEDGHEHRGQKQGGGVGVGRGSGPEAARQQHLLQKTQG
jgi:hypothetical protein